MNCDKCERDLIVEQDLVNNNHIMLKKQDQQDQQIQSPSIVNKVAQVRPPFLFDPSVFRLLNRKDMKLSYETFEQMENEQNGVHYNLGEGLILRALRRDDYFHGFLGLLSQLTVVGDVSQAEFEQRFDAMQSCASTYFTMVIYDTVMDRVAAALTVVHEQKFIRQCGARGRIEDVVVDEKYRGKRLSKILLDFGCQLAKVLGCYKLSLECKDDLRALYEQFEFRLEDKQNYLCRRF